MATISKKSKDINKLLNKLYIKDRKSIIEWLDGVKAQGTSDGVVNGLLNNSKIKILTTSEDGVYNLILLWINEHIEDFSDYDFRGIPNSSFISIIDKNSFSIKKKNAFNSEEDVQRWCDNPEVHPIHGNYISAMGYEYFLVYEKAFNIMAKKAVPYKNIREMFPKNHILYGQSLDFLYFTCIRKRVKRYEEPDSRRIFDDNNTFEIVAILEFLSENIENMADTSTVLETELELLNNRFNDRDGHKNSTRFATQVAALITKITSSFLTKKYPTFTSFIADFSSNKTMSIIHFLRNYRLSNGQLILEFINNNNVLWTINLRKLIKNYESCINDISDYYDIESGIIINPEDIKHLPIEDPLDKYFETFEEKLAEIRKPIYSKLIDLTTFKPIELTNYLNDAEYSKYKKEKDKYETIREKYNKSLVDYESTRRGNSPVVPVKPKITLPWGKIHTIGQEIDPIHIKDSVIESFNIEYMRARSTIDEYNRIKNMSYIELKRYSGNSPSSEEIRQIEQNELFKMTKEEINENVLFDYTDLADKCSENIDILTNEELNDENYPLSKLQLMVRLKVYTPDKKKYRTECVYAPKLYNYLIKCINEKEPFVNPVTKAKYTEDNIIELINVMKIIDPKIERPHFIRHMNDSELKIEYSLVTKTIELKDGQGAYVLSFYKIYLTRIIGLVKYNVYDICCIPSDIESSLNIDNAKFATGSTDLTSNVMLFRIFKLFRDGRLLHNYLQPYYIPIGNHSIRYIKPDIHFNRYKTTSEWYYNTELEENRTPLEYVEMFKHYCQEINNYIY